MLLDRTPDGAAKPAFQWLVRLLAVFAVSTATLLLVDAWFDVCTAPAGGPLVMALIDMCIEVAEAAGCVALAVGVFRIAPQRYERSH